MEQFEGMEEKYIETNGIKLHTMIIGSGKPLMLLHGAPDYWYGWRDVIPGLKDKYMLIIPDTRGINLSDRPEGVENYALKKTIEDIKGLAEALDLGKFNLGGHDVGGVIAWAFAELYPELLNNLIICNAPHQVSFGKLIRKDKMQRRASAYAFEFIKDDSDKFWKANDSQFLKLFVFGHPRRKEAFNESDKRKYIRFWSQPGSIHAILNYFRATFKFPIKLTGDIKVPTLVIHGMRDIALTPKILDGLSEYIPNLKIVRVENASHWVMIDAPEVVASSIKEFIG